MPVRLPSIASSYGTLPARPFGDCRRLRNLSSSVAGGIFFELLPSPVHLPVCSVFSKYCARWSWGNISPSHLMLLNTSRALAWMPCWTCWYDLSSTLSLIWWTVSRLLEPLLSECPIVSLHIQPRCDEIGCWKSLNIKQSLNQSWWVFYSFSGYIFWTTLRVIVAVTSFREYPACTMKLWWR